jgi:hypothetical protein
MKDARFPYLLLGGVLLLLTFAAIRTAIAAEPLTFTRHFEYTAVDACVGFNAISEMVEDHRVTMFFDNEGTAVGFQNHVTIEATITNSVTLTTVSDRSKFTVFVDFEDGTRTWAGKILATTVAGEGIVIHDAGKIVFDWPAHSNLIFVAGTHQFFLEGGTSLFCAAVD